ncbi:MAG: hypothetical protein L6R28_15140 [Planctomycetes bacterium]|nr:hypothetical protein [Planctomycetota bacterium]
MRRNPLQCQYFLVFFLAIFSTTIYSEDKPIGNWDQCKDLLYAGYDRAKFLEILERKNFDINYCDSQKSNLLHYAVICDNHDAIKTLLDRNCSVSQADDHDMLPLDYVRSATAYELLINRNAAWGKKAYALGLASDIKNRFGIRKMIECKVFDVNEKLNYGRGYFRGGTILHGWASDCTADKEDISLLNWLLENGADVNAVNDAELTPMDCATEVAASVLEKKGGALARTLKADLAWHIALVI